MADDVKTEFSIKDIPFKEFKKLGIDKEKIMNTPTLEALLRGEKTKIFPFEKFENLNAEVRFKIERDSKNKPALVVYPEKMELKVEREKLVENLLKIKGVEDATKSIQGKGLDKGEKLENSLQNPKQVEAYIDQVKLYSGKDITPKELLKDTWLKVNDKIAEQYIKETKMPVIKEKGDFYVGLKLEGMDKHSFKQTEQKLAEFSSSLGKEKEVNITLSR